MAIITDPLPYPKTDKVPVPANEDPRQYVQATDWNTVCSVVDSIRDEGGGGSGTVTSITAGTGLSGGTITTSGTIAIDSTVATLTGSQTLTNKVLSTTGDITPAADKTQVIGAASTGRYLRVFTTEVDSGGTDDLLLQTNNFDRLFLGRTTTNVLTSGAANGSSAVGNVIDTFPNYTTAGAKILSVRTATAEVLAVDRTGVLITPTAAVTTDVASATTGTTGFFIVKNGGTAQWTAHPFSGNGATLAAGTSDAYLLGGGSSILLARASGLQDYMAVNTGSITWGVNSNVSAYKLNTTSFSPDTGSTSGVPDLGTSSKKWGTVWARAYAGVHQDVTASGAVSIDTQLGEMCVLTSSGNISGITLAAGLSGQLFTLEMVQGNVSHTWPTSFVNARIAGGAFTKSAATSAIDTITYRYNSTASKWDEISRTLALA
jgi:hypothetical protein